MANYAVSARSLRVVRARNEILHGLDFGIEAGQATGLVLPHPDGPTSPVACPGSMPKSSPCRISLRARTTRSERADTA